MPTVWGIFCFITKGFCFTKILTSSLRFEPLFGCGAIVNTLNNKHQGNPLPNLACQLLLHSTCDLTLPLLLQNYRSSLIRCKTCLKRHHIFSLSLHRIFSPGMVFHPLWFSFHLKGDRYQIFSSWIICLSFRERQGTWEGARDTW